MKAGRMARWAGALLLLALAAVSLRSCSEAARLRGVAEAKEAAYRATRDSLEAERARFARIDSARADSLEALRARAVRLASERRGRQAATTASLDTVRAALPDTLRHLADRLSARLQRERETHRAELAARDRTIDILREQLAARDRMIALQRAALAEADSVIAAKNVAIEAAAPSGFLHIAVPSALVGVLGVAAGIVVGQAL